MSVIRINNITNKDRTSGPTISGITTVSSTGFMRVPVGSTGRRLVSDFVPNSIIDDGLILYLDAGNSASYSGSGTTWTDLSGFDNNATLMNGVSYNRDNGGSLVFDGVDDYIDSGKTSTQFGINNVSNSFSFLIWFKTTKADEYYMFDNYDGSAEDLSFRIENNQMEVYLSASGGNINSVNFGNFSSNTWNFASYVWDGSTKTITCYINAVNAGSQSNTNMTNTFESGSNLYIGARPVSSSYFSGNISQVSIYNRALSAAEVQQNYNALRSRYPT